MFSVLIPLYNKEKYIYATIMSVLHQTFADFEIIVVNDSSTDRSLEIVFQIKDERLKVFTKKMEVCLLQETMVSVRQRINILHF